MQHRLHRRELPEATVRLVEKRRDLVGVLRPARLLRGDPGRVSLPGRGDQVGGDQDVLAQERGQLPARRPAV
jgi:hypothetical protein